MVSLTKEDAYLELIVNTEVPLSSSEIAEKLEISPVTVWRYANKLKDRIAQEAKDLCRKMAIEMVQQLRKNAKNGDSGAAVKILEIGDVYIPAKKQTFEGLPKDVIILLPTRETQSALDPAKEVKPDDNS